MRYILFLILMPMLAQAQTPKNVLQQDLLWFRYQNQLMISPKWLLQSEIDNRIFFGPLKEHHLVMRTQGRYNIHEQLQAGAGVTYALQHPQDPKSESKLAIPELRTQQDITLKQSVWKVSLYHRYMVEERFIRKVKEQELQPGYNFSFRFRYRLQADIPLVKNEVQNLGLVLYDEVMVQFGRTTGKHVFDQNRMYAGLKWGVSPAWALEAGYLHWFQQRATGTDFFSRDIARVSIYHKVTLKKDDK
ncbi:DUF2490 domain-containing protein [Pontibacter beigongshangensis]|uniref:DUF2490 domain-containing protein n=1 Tax=Pontibacter beigongshangensis TaxID=2574733 RepID=UPI00164FE84D|nr:DUF2490 domain-containing protein [Pontibacter beigongshangensis]